MDFDGCVAVITGGASGIGLGIAKALLGEGANVALLDLRRDHLDTASADLARSGYAGRIAGFIVDVSDREAMREVAAAVIERFGHVDLLVNNAGVGIQRPWPKVDFADWDFGLEVNLGGVINGLMIYLPILESGGGGHIVNTASLAGIAPFPSSLAIYGTTKTAVVALSESIAPELEARGIGISILCPGLVRSAIHEIDQNRPPRFREKVADRDTLAEDADRDSSSSWIEPDVVGRMVVEGIRSRSRYIITHAEHRDAFERRCAAILEAWPRPAGS